MLDPCLTRLKGHDYSGPEERDARNLRDRQAEQDAAVDRSAAPPTADAARRLVSVYDGGQMPNRPDRIYLAHPVDLDGGEAEAGTASPNVDPSATIPVVVLWHAPQAGDLLVATSVGGRWVAERGGAAGSKICVTACGNLPVSGAAVTVLSGSQTAASGTTGTDGCCQLPVSGTYSIQIAIGTTVVYSSTRPLPAGGTTAISVGSDGLVCCGSYAVPQALTLTDADGSLTFVYDPNESFPVWTGGHAVRRLSCTITTPNRICIAAPPAQGPVRICYQMTCNAGQVPTFTVQRSWSWVYQQGSPTPIWFQDPTGFAPGQYCITAPPPICGNPLTDAATFGANPVPGGPFALSGTPAPAPSNATSDPVGGSIAISA